MRPLQQLPSADFLLSSLSSSPITTQSDSFDETPAPPDSMKTQISQHVLIYSELRLSVLGQ